MQRLIGNHLVIASAALIALATAGLVMGGYLSAGGSNEATAATDVAFDFETPGAEPEAPDTSPIVAGPEAPEPAPVETIPEPAPVEAKPAAVEAKSAAIEKRAKPTRTARPNPKPKPTSSRTKAGDAAAAKGHFDEATRFYLRGKLADAEQKYKAAIAADRAFAPAYRGLGLLYQRRGKNYLAVKNLRTYLKLSPWSADADATRERIESLE